MRKPESPGSSTKLNNGASDNSNEREESLSGSRGHLPTTPEMDEFFSGAEEEQQKIFIDKYELLSCVVTKPFWLWVSQFWSALFCRVPKLFFFLFRYNFDPVNEQPLPGRFEWKKVDD